MTNTCEYKKIIDEEEDIEEQVDKPSKQIKVTAKVVSYAPLVTEKSTGGSTLGAWVGGMLGLLLFGPIGMILLAFGGWFFGPKRSSRGSCYSCCCKCTLITLISLFLLTLVAGLGFAYFYFAWVPYAVQEMTVPTPSSSSPTPFPIVNMTDAELKAFMDRIEVFVENVKAGETPAQDLVLTQDELNGAVGHIDYFHGNFMVTLHKDVMKEEFNLPVDMLPGGNGRSFVGFDRLQILDDAVAYEITTEAKHEDLFNGPLFFVQLQYLITQIKNEEQYGEKMLMLFLQKGSIFGQEAPKDFIEQHQNLMQYLYQQNDPDMQDSIREILAHVESVSIEEGKIVVKAVRSN